jgi:hypothetical protein
LWKDAKELKFRKYAQEAGKWLFETSFLTNGFENICRELDLNTEWVRRYARKLTKEDVKKLEFKEREGKDFLLLALGAARSQWQP